MITVPNATVPLVDDKGRPLPIFLKLLNLIASALPKAPALSASTPYDPPNILAGGVTTTTVSVPGALPNGTQVAESSFSTALGGLVLFSYISGPGVVTVAFYNPTAGPINLAVGTLTVFVWTP